MCIHACDLAKNDWMAVLICSVVSWARLKYCISTTEHESLSDISAEVGSN